MIKKGTVLRTKHTKTVWMMDGYAIVFNNSGKRIGCICVGFMAVESEWHN